MARVQLDGLDDLMEELEKYSDIGKVAPKMIDSATPILEKNIKKNIQQAANRGYATGELAESVKATEAKQNNYGYFAAVGVTGTDSRGVRNGEKMAYLEYGTMKDGKQRTAPHPVMQRSINESETPCLEKMQQVFDMEVGK